MDFVRDTLADESAFRALTIVDTCTREYAAIEVDLGLGVVAVLEGSLTPTLTEACLVGSPVPDAIVPETKPAIGNFIVLTSAEAGRL
jgi:hypothetical protein